MGTDMLQHQLAACIRSALEQHQFARPQTPDTRITDAYASAAAEAVLLHLLAGGWLLTKAAGDWSWSGEMSASELEEALRSSLRFPLLKARKPPRRRDAASMDQYHSRTAEDIGRHLLRDGWSLAPALLKKPTLPRHSTSQFMSKSD
jgi:hypothetical protein